MSCGGPANEYIEELARELRVRWHYRRRVLAEIRAHMEDLVEREERFGLSTEEAERRAVQQLGPVTAVADGLTTVRRQVVARRHARAVRMIAYLGAALVLVCASFASLATGDVDSHLGLEVAAAAAGAIAVLLLDGWDGVSTRVALAGVIGGWIAVTALLLGDGEVAFCGQVLAGVIGAAAILQAGRRIPWRARGGG